MRNSKVKGFTLVELIVVIAIIAILAAILVPNMLGYIKDSRWTQAEANAKTVHTAANAALAKEYSKGTFGDAAAGANTPHGPFTIEGIDGTVDLTITLDDSNSTELDLEVGVGDKFKGHANIWVDPSYSGITEVVWCGINATLPDTIPASLDKKTETTIQGWFPLLPEQAAAADGNNP